MWDETTIELFRHLSGGTGKIIMKTFSYNYRYSDRDSKLGPIKPDEVLTTTSRCWVYLLIIQI